MKRRERQSTVTFVSGAGALIAGISAMLITWGLVAGAHASAAGQLIAEGAVMLLAVACVAMARQLYGRQSTLEQWGEVLDERSKLLDMRERRLNEREKNLSYWEMIRR